jgi:trehalose 6-phosphate synthase/phosphatase
MASMAGYGSSHDVDIYAQIIPASSSSSTMTSLKNHRVIIASLFLPTTAVVGESAPATPDTQASQPEFPTQFSLGNDKTARPLGKHVRQTSGSGLLPPIRSIVEDLKDKTVRWSRRF